MYLRKLFFRQIAHLTDGIDRNKYLWINISHIIHQLTVFLLVYNSDQLSARCIVVSANNQKSNIHNQRNRGKRKWNEIAENHRQCRTAADRHMTGKHEEKHCICHDHIANRDDSKFFR